MSWVIKSDGFRGRGEGETWQDFQQKHKLTPMTDEVQQMGLRSETPFLSSLSPKVIKEMFEMHGQLDPLSYQEYLRVLIGVIVPLDKMDSFVNSLEMTYNALVGE